jgi:hypothetical protein
VSTPFSFGGGLYLLVVPERNQRVPRPRPATTGSWLHVPYSSRNIFVTDAGRLHTVWSPAGGIVIPDAGSYSTFEGLYDRFGLLITPWGSVTARLDTLDVAEYDDGTWRGNCAWSWS